VTPRAWALRAGPLPGVYLGELADAEGLNRALSAAFEAHREGPNSRRTHLFNGRYENIYIDQRKIPAVSPVLAAAREFAGSLLRRDDLRLGFWFNCMGPGERTGLHTHDDADELLSGVYYVAAAEGSGRLVLHAGPEQYRISPRPGRFVFFDPALPHAVEPNASGRTRLSVAFNFGPAGQG
jgi:hypothetical protein